MKNLYKPALLFVLLVSFVIAKGNKTPILFVNYYSEGISADKYKRQEVMIPMRDGIKLNTVIFTPVEQTEALPFLLERTPYGVSDYPSPERNGYVKDMADDGYIFVYQD